MQKLLSTSEFADAVGISESTARRLADGGELRIQKTKGGHRKIPVTEAVRYVREARIRVVKPELLGLATPELTAHSSYSDRLLNALREGHAASVIGLMRSMYAEGVSLAEICDGPIRYAMNAIGATWPQDKRSIFVEHRATLLCVRALCQIRLALPEAEENALTAMGAAPQDDPYLLPSLMVSLVLHEVGFDETNLGPNTPVDVLTDSVEDEQPNLVWLAITNPIRSRRHHQEIENLAKIVSSYGGLFLIGGQSAETFSGPRATICDSMSELSLKSAALQKSQ
jgi:excisionase family DNA binding protein